MSSFSSVHTDVAHESLSSQIVVLDTIKRIVSTIDSDIIPGSLEIPFNPGQNVVGSSVSKDSPQTVIRLSPTSQHVNYLPKNQIIHPIELTFTITADKAPTHDMRFAVYTDAANCLPSRYNLYINGATTASNTYHRAEAICTNASLPQEVIESDPNFTTMTKILNNEQIPGTYITFPKGETKKTYTVRINTTIDLSYLTPLTSNIIFTIAEYGDLDIGLFYDNLDQAFHITPIPETLFANNAVSVSNFHVLEKLPFNKAFKVTTSTSQEVASAANTIAQAAAGEKVQFTATLDTWTATGRGIGILQHNFLIRETSVQALRDYMAIDNHIAIPTQHWTTVMSTNLPSNPGMNSLTFNVQASNINLIAFTFPYRADTLTYLPNPRMSNITITVDGKSSLTQQAYDYIDARAVKDIAQSLLNDDVWGMNENLRDSLNLLPYTGVPYDKTAYAGVYSDTGGPIINRPNSFVVAVACSPCHSFMRGYCMASNATARSQIIINFSLGENIDQGIDQLNPGPVTATTSPSYCSCLQDVVLSLMYDPMTRKCKAGQIVFTQPKFM